MATTDSSLGHLPSPATALVGRDEDIARITESLVTPGRRLVSLIGPGGIGKTRLAIAAARRFADEHARESSFVALSALPSAERLAEAIADALQIPQLGQADPRARLLTFLSDKELFLVLDNFEHLLDGAGLVAEMLDCAPELMLLVTSREALGLRDEWRLMVHGLTLPEGDDASATREYPAVLLFAERAEQASSDFSLSKELESVLHICRAVEGSPLAIELAASWTASLPCAEIASEIDRNIDFLATGLRDVPDRHRSMRAVFEQSWARLSENEASVFKRLSVFRGGFQREAAEQVAGSTLRTLASLVNTSLVRSDSDGRYRLHELLRQYAEGKLAESPEDVDDTRAAHCDFYIGHLEAQTPGIAGGKQLEAAEEIARELDNILAAWECAVEHHDVGKVCRSTDTLSMLYQFRGRYAEGLARFSAAAEILRGAEHSQEQQSALVVLLVAAGWFSIRVGNIEKARVVIEECQEIYAGLGFPNFPGFATEPLAPAGVIALIEGDFGKAELLGSEALRIAKGHGNDSNAALAHYVLTSAHAASGHYDEAREHGRRAYDLARKNGDQWFMAYCLNELGNVASLVEEFDAAKEYFSASYEIRREFEDPEGMAVALNRLGDLAILRSDHRVAATLFRRALAIYRQINDQGGLGDAFRGLGESSRAAGSYRQAARYFHQSLEITRSIGHVPLTLSVLAGIGELFAQTGKEALASRVLSTVRDHPGVDTQTGARVKDALAKAAPGARR